MEEDGTVPRLDLLSLDEEPLGPSTDNMHRLRKRKGGPKWVRKLTRMVESMSRTSTDEVPLGIVAQEIWEGIIELDKDGRQFVQDEAKNKKQREKAKRKKAKAKAKKKAWKERILRKEEDRKKLKIPSDSSSGWDSSDKSMDTSSSDSSSDSSIDSLTMGRSQRRRARVEVMD